MFCKLKNLTDSNKLYKLLEGETCICVLARMVANTDIQLYTPFLDKRNDLSLDNYPEVSLDDARSHHSGFYQEALDQTA